MPRIRSIKPEITADRKLAGVSRDARLTFIYCWTVADDDGLFRAEHRQLLGSLYPFDATVEPQDLELWLSELVQIGALRWRYTQDGARVGEVVHWERHQVVKNRSKPFLLGQLQPFSVEPPETVRRVSGDPGGAESCSLESRVLSLESSSCTAPCGAAEKQPTDSIAAEFDEWWTRYPKRSGGNPRKKALGAYRARRQEGVAKESLFAGVDRYAAWAEATGKMGSETVKMAQFWLSPTFEGWAQDWTPPDEPLSSLGFADDDFD